MITEQLRNRKLRQRGADLVLPDTKDTRGPHGRGRAQTTIREREDMGNLSHLDALEAEAIYIIREVAAEAEKPVMLYSIGKDSTVMMHLALKAF